MSDQIEVADVESVVIRPSTVSRSGIEQSCLLETSDPAVADDCTTHAHLPADDAAVLVFENGASHRYVVTGDLDNFAARVVMAVAEVSR